MTDINKLTSSDLKGILFTVEGIDPAKFDTLATRNFSGWKYMRKIRCGTQSSCASRAGWRIVPL